VKYPALLVLSTVILQLLLARLVWGQEPATPSSQFAESYAGFEGRTVSKIEIAMAPGGDESGLRALISLKPGQPFSIEKLRESVAAIQSHQKFEQIQASLEPEANGIKVVLLLQPVFHVGLVSFPGAAGRFNYSTLLLTSQI
jgi:outer membrane protein assembly factor BamA